MIRKIIIWAIVLLSMGLSVGTRAKDLTGREAVIRSIRDNFIARNSEFTITMSKNTLTELLEDSDFLNTAALTDNPATSRDGDYIRVSVVSWRAKWTYDLADKASLTVYADYRTTPEQEQMLDMAIVNAMDSINISNASEYEKVKAIHDYIISMVSYDQTLTKYSAYNAFIDRSAVCLGYAAAAYRMFTEAGLKSGIIAGMAGGEEHVWNIVKVDGKWYNIDLTWDDPILDNGESMISYDFFLKNNEDFYDHLRAPEYSTEEFLLAHEIAGESYILK